MPPTETVPFTIGELRALLKGYASDLRLDWVVRAQSPLHVDEANLLEVQHVTRVRCDHLVRLVLWCKAMP